MTEVVLRRRSDDFDDQPDYTQRVVTRYRYKPSSSNYRDDYSERDSVVEVDQESDRGRRYRYAKSARSYSESPDRGRMLVHAPTDGALVIREHGRDELARRPPYDEDLAAWERRRYEDERRRYEDRRYPQVAAVALPPRQHHRQDDHSSSSDSESGRRRHRSGKEKAEHGRHIVEGALAGAVITDLARKRSRKSGSKNRGRDVAGGAIIGGLAVEAASKFKEYQDDREKGSNRRRGRKDDRATGLQRRSSSHDTAKKLAELGIGAVAVGALVNYGLKKSRESKEAKNPQAIMQARPNSHSRSGSRSRSRSRSRGRHSTKEKEDQSRRKSVAAGVGAAAVAGAAALYARSHSLKRAQSHATGPGSQRPHSPDLWEAAKENKGALAVAGVTAAALAAYANKKNKDALEKRSKSRSRSRHGKHSRSGSRHSAHESDGDMVEYGSDPIAINDSESRRGRRRSRSGSRSRRPSVSDRIKGTAEGLIAAGAAAVGANEIRKKYEDRKAEREGNGNEDEDQHRRHRRSSSVSPNQSDGGYHSPGEAGVYPVQHSYQPNGYNHHVPAYAPGSAAQGQNIQGPPHPYDNYRDYPSADDLV